MATEFGQRLCKLRKNKELSLEELARAVSSTKSYIWDLENKDSIRPSAEMVYKLADALETTVNFLMGEARLHDLAERDQVFFRNYQRLKPETKKQLSAIMDALTEADGK